MGSLNAVKEIHLETIKIFKVPEFWNSYLLNMKADAMMYLSDDVEFFQDTLENAITEYEKHFPNFDGVLGLNQVNIPDSQALQSAFGIIGKNFINYFSNKQVWCPSYYRFYGDRELWLFAKSINKFKFCEEAKIFNNHPAFTGEIDYTHKEVRKYLRQDRIMYEKRQSKNLIWGKTFELINKE